MKTRSLFLLHLLLLHQGRFLVDGDSSTVLSKEGIRMAYNKESVLYQVDGRRYIFLDNPDGA